MSDDDRWEKAEQLDVLHDKLEELREELENTGKVYEAQCAVTDDLSARLAALTALVRQMEEALHELACYSNGQPDYCGSPCEAKVRAALAKAREKGDLS